MRRILLSAVACLAVALLTALTTISAGRAAADPGPRPGQGIDASAAPIRVIQHNTDHVPEAWQFAVQQIEEHQPELATIQEVCRPWFDALQETHPQWTMAYHARKKHNGNSNNPGCHGDDIGEAVIYTRAPGRPTTVIDYPNNNADGVEKFGLACIEFSHRGIPTLGCSTHLSAYPTSGGRGTQPERGPQVAAIMAHTAPYRAAGWAVIVGGDLNMGSSNDKHAADLNQILGPEVGGTGEFYDASQLELGIRQTRPTTDKGNRIDYVLFAGSRTPWGTAGVTMSYEDSPAGHHLLTADAVLLRTIS